MTLRTPLRSCLLSLLASVSFLGGVALANTSVNVNKFEDDIDIKTALLRPCEKGIGYDCVKVDVQMQVDAPQEIVWQVITD